MLGEVAVPLLASQVREFVKQFLDFSVHPLNWPQPDPPRQFWNVSDYSPVQAFANVQARALRCLINNTENHNPAASKSARARGSGVVTAGAFSPWAEAPLT